jgi:hypothetical protein
MALVLADRVKQSTTTTGVSDFVLSGSLTGFQTFAAGVGANNTTYYSVADGADFEVGLGTLSNDGLTLARTTVLQSSNADAKVSFAAGTKEVFVTYPADKAVSDITSTDASIVVSRNGSIFDLAVSEASPASTLLAAVRNTTGATLTKGTAVYISGSTGQNSTVSKALATGDSTSAQTLGLITSDLANNSNGYVTVIGLVINIDTSAYTDGAQLYLSPTTAGTLTATKPYAPNHMVYVAIVERAHATLGKLFVKVQNGYEMDELHNVSAQSPTTGQTLVYNASTSLWEKNTVSLTAGVNGTLPVANGGTGITSLGTGVATFLGTPSSANLLAAVTDETGTGALVFANTPTLVTPILGTPTSATLTNATGLPIASGVSGLGTGVATFLATPSSANLIAALTDETGTGSAVFANSPTLVTPALGTPSGLVGTNITGTATNFTASNVTTNANLTGDVTSLGNATTLTNAPVIAKVLTGYVSAAGTVAATDSILQAIQKLNGNDATNANLTGMVTSVGNATTVVTNANLTGAVTSSGNATSLGSFTSAQLLAALTDETGTGANVFATSPTLVTPALGTPSALVGTNITGTAANFNINGTVGATTPSTGNFTTLTENSVAVVTQSDIGSAPNEIPLNQYLGSLAYQNGDAYYNTGMTVGYRNRLFNGSMQIDQRNAGASVTATTANEYSLDRWKTASSVSSKFTVQQSSVAPTGYINSLLVTSSSAYSVGAGDYFIIGQRIEGLNSFDLGFGTANASIVTLSFWVRSSLTGTFGGSLANSANNRSYAFTYTISSANTWEQKFVTIGGDTSGTWLTTNGIGIRVNFGLGVGSTYSGTAGSWAGTEYDSATGATSVVGTNGATWYVTGVQLEKGNIATSFDVRPYGTELALCQRYFEKSNYSSGDYIGSSGFAQTSGNAYFSYVCAVEKRATPTWTSSGTFRGQGLADTGTSTAVSLTNQGNRSVNIILTSTFSGTNGQAVNLQAQSTSSLQVSSEL